MTIDHTIPHVYVNFGEAPGPFLTLSVRSRYRPMPERCFAKSAPIASHWQLHVNGRWRRLYVSSKYPNNFVVVDRKRHHVVFIPPSDLPTNGA